MHRGFENPRLFKDRPTDGNPAAAPHPSTCAVAHATVRGHAYISQQPTAAWCNALFCCRHGHPSSRRNPHTHKGPHIFPPPIAAPSATAQTATRIPLKARIYYRSQMQPRPQDSLSVTLATLPCYPTTLNLRMPSVARVSLADCFALWGKCTEGLKPPSYSKTVLWTETQRLRRILLSISMCSSVCNHAGYAFISQQPTAAWCNALFGCRHGRPSSRRNPRTPLKARIYFHTNRSPVRRTVSQ